MRQSNKIDPVNLVVWSLILILSGVTLAVFLSVLVDLFKVLIGQ